jgi:hypothetical protein
MLDKNIMDKIIPEVYCERGAPMGRRNIGRRSTYKRVYDRLVPMCTCCGAYDKGGAYWGLGKRLRVAFHADLSYIEFYRGEKRK